MAASLGAEPWSSDPETTALYRFAGRSRAPLAAQREHARQVLSSVAERFEEIGLGALDPPALVRMIATLERELRWVLDELDRVDEEQATLRAHRRVAAFGG